MLRAGSALQQIARLDTCLLSEGARSFASASSYVFSSTQDAPVSSLGSKIRVTVAPKGKKDLDVTCTAGATTVKTKYAASDLRKLANKEVSLVDVARISVLHSSLMDYLVRLSNERYNVLAQWPDFTTMFGKDYYYRAHPDDLKKFYSMVDEFHRMYDVATEFNSLSHLSSELVPSFRARHLNAIHPAMGPTIGNAAATQYLLSMAQ